MFKAPRINEICCVLSTLCVGIGIAENNTSVVIWNAIAAALNALVIIMYYKTHPDK
jgi:hypothetical protein